MSGLVEELQKEALDGNIPVSNLLRKALAVSKKLKIAHIEKWILNELSGYKNGEDIPSYREVQGEVKAFNPYQGWIPVQFPTEAMAEKFSIRKVNSSIGELDDLQTKKKEDSSLEMPYPPSIHNKLMGYEGFRVTLFIPPSTVAGILDAVRNNILNWSLQLEQENIFGEGMSFSSNEKEIASRSTYNITNIGSMHNSQLQQNSDSSVQTLNIKIDLNNVSKLVNKINESIHELDLVEEKQNELLTDIKTIDSQVKSPNPKTKIIIEALKSIKDILTGVASNVLAQGFLTEIAKYLV